MGDIGSQPARESRRVVRVGTRGSALALTQTGQVMASLESANPGLKCERMIIKTTGDARQDVSFAAVGVKGMFVKEIEEALLSGEIDFAVHSMKDMPGELPEGLTLAATPEREDARDALLSSGRRLSDLPNGARLGTSSLRRAVQAKHLRPDLVVEELRGNLDTRIRKLDEGQYDAIVLACAGLVRMGWSERIVERLNFEQHVPAPGQGVLALEAREDDHATLSLLAALNDPETADAIAAERAFQAALGLGCGVPVGAHARVLDDRITMRGMMAEADGSRYREITLNGKRSDAVNMGRLLAEALLRGSVA
jgi:hydroxymethylbilane synthase